MHGTIFIIAEIIEIFGWLSSTFRSQPLADGPYCYMARIEKDPKTMPVVKADRIYRLDWDVQRPNADSKNVCWYNMFASPTIVLGYPIARRAEQETGLEIPMAIIEVLLQNASIHVLDNRLYLKGFAAMLIPTKRSGKLLMWHYQYNENGNYIDFLEADVGQMEPVDYHELGRYRHIVGWSQEAIFNVGECRFRLDYHANYQRLSMARRAIHWTFRARSSNSDIWLQDLLYFWRLYGRQLCFSSRAWHQRPS